MFKLTHYPIQVHDLEQSTLDQVGGVVTFEGRVRNDNFGRKVKQLEYEAFAELAESEGMKIIAEAKEKFSIEKATCLHRTGILVVRELAVWIVVYAKHRGAAFKAAEYIIDQVKARVPIWKKEYYEDGDSTWVKCLACAHSESPSLSMTEKKPDEHFHHPR